ncbi:hypothetical protein [Clostridium sp. C8-1-8]|uniref:hypothetical protein n=1 Tax=Clostridium sp. C8-1-8 TaxID=2698831 RepID=UPI00137208BF|nr:hypothetical protein [Clostridium sp. C8-1-8]
MVEDTSDVYKLIRNFKSKGKTFEFRLSEYNCYRLSNGKCSMDTTLGKSELSLEYDQYDYCDIHYCPTLCNSVKVLGMQDKNHTVRITKNSCGHYTITDGQHRLCSSSHRDMSIEAYVEENGTICPKCYWRNKSLLYRLRDLFKLNNTFLKKL